MIDINGNEYLSSDGTELIENSKNLKPFAEEGGSASFPEGGQIGDVLSPDPDDLSKVIWNNKKTDKPTDVSGTFLYVLKNINGTISWSRISMSDYYLPWFSSTGDTFANSVIYQHTNGNVGVSTTNPTVKLDVNGRVKSDGITFTTVASNSTSNTLWVNSSGYLMYGNSTDKNAVSFTSEPITISSNLTLSNTHHGRTIRITSNVIITIPTGLRDDFESYFIVVGNFTATFTEGSGITFYKPFGNKLTEGFTCLVEKTSSGNFDLIGNLIT